MKIRWVSLSRGETRDNRGYWRSLEGRFNISPRYRGCVYPDSYHVRDNHGQGVGGGIRKESSFDTVRDCKAWAQQIIDKEIGELIDLIDSDPPPGVGVPVAAAEVV